MDKQPERLISSDKVKKWWYDRFDEWGPDTLPSDYFSDLHAGTFDPDPIPLPTIKPGDKEWNIFEQIKERIGEAINDSDEMGWRYALSDIQNIVLGWEDELE